MRYTTPPPALLTCHDRTTAEEAFTLWLLLFLEEIGFSGEVHCRCFLASPTGKMRRPDIYIPRYALPIEIDGRTRDVWQTRIDDSADRDAFYAALGARPPLVVQATWIVSDLKMARLKRELRDFLFACRLSPAQLGLVNKRICDGRKRVEVNNPGIFQSSGSAAPQFCDELGQRGFREFRHFGGTRFILRSKYKKRWKGLDFNFAAYVRSDKYVEDAIRKMNEKFDRPKRPGSGEIFLDDDERPCEAANRPRKP